MGRYGCSIIGSSVDGSIGLLEDIKIRTGRVGLRPTTDQTVNHAIGRFFGAQLAIGRTTFARVSLSAQYQEHAKIIDPALNFASRRIDGLPIRKGLGRKKGQDKSGRRQVKFPGFADARQSHNEGITFGWDSIPRPSQVPLVSDVGVQGQTQEHTADDGHPIRFQDRTLPFAPQPQAIGFVFTNDGSIGL